MRSIVVFGSYASSRRRVRGSTSLSGGNQVDALPPAPVTQRAMYAGEWCKALSSIFCLRAALRANFDISKFHMTMIHSCRLLEIIVLGSADTRIRHFRITFKLSCGSLASQIDYRKDLDF